MLAPGGAFYFEDLFRDPNYLQSIRVTVIFAVSVTILSMVPALLLAVMVELLLRRTRLGFALRVVGQNPDAAAAAGLRIGWIQTLALTLSGGLAGLGGANFVLGYKYYYEDGFSAGVGYLGIAVAVLAHNRPLWVLLSALFFGTLAQGGLAVNAMVPRELIDVLSAVVILAVATASAEVRRLLPRFQQPQRDDDSRDARPSKPPSREPEPTLLPEPPLDEPEATDSVSPWAAR